MMMMQVLRTMMRIRMIVYVGVNDDGGDDDEYDADDDDDSSGYGVGDGEETMPKLRLMLF